MIRVFLGGEGPCELGSLAREPAYRDPPFPGVLEALLRKVGSGGWVVVGARTWKSIRKYRVGDHRQMETRNVLGLALEARENGCGMLAFVRDRDGTRTQPNREREADICRGIEEASMLWDGVLKIVGGVAVVRLESWILALRGVLRSEEDRRPEESLRADGIGPKDTKAYVRVVEEADLSSVPADAVSLRSWVQAAGHVRGDDPL